MIQTDENKKLRVNRLASSIFNAIIQIHGEELKAGPVGLFLLLMEPVPGGVDGEVYGAARKFVPGTMDEPVKVHMSMVHAVARGDYLPDTNGMVLIHKDMLEEIVTDE